jgi:hypothetical protein
MLCLLLAEFRAQYGCTPAVETASLLYQSGSVRHTLKELTDTMNLMIDAGSRYKNIERVLGAGSTLLLGQNISESS